MELNFLNCQPVRELVVVPVGSCSRSGSDIIVRTCVIKSSPRYVQSIHFSHSNISRSKINILYLIVRSICSESASEIRACCVVFDCL